MVGVNEKGHKTCKDHRGFGSKKETADLRSAHAPYITRYERDNNVRGMFSESHNTAITETPIKEVVELEKPCGNDASSI